VSDTLWRLAWALPLVCGAGLCAMLILRRLLMTTAARRPANRLEAIETLSVSDDTRIVLLELDQQAFLVVESSRQATLVAATRSQAAGPARPRRWGRRVMRILEQRT
jgi:flagellar biogenesis protein FliO